MKEVIVYDQVSRDHPVSRIRSQSNQHCPQLQCIKDNCQQGAKGSERTVLWSSVFVTLVAKKYRFMHFELDMVFDTH